MLCREKAATGVGDRTAEKRIQQLLFVKVIYPHIYFLHNNYGRVWVRFERLSRIPCCTKRAQWGMRDVEDVGRGIMAGTISQSAEMEVAAKEERRR